MRQGEAEVDERDQGNEGERRGESPGSPRAGSLLRLGFAGLAQPVAVCVLANSKDDEEQRPGQEQLP